MQKKLFISKNLLFMACSCKNNSSNKQVTTVKQVVKKEKNNTVMASSRPERKPLFKRVILK